MPLGERGDKKYEDLPLSTLFKSSCWESGGQSRQSPFHCGEGTVSFLKVRETHTPGEVSTVITTCSSSLTQFVTPFFPNTEGSWGINYISHPADTRRARVVWWGKGKMGQNTHFSQINFVEEIYLSFGNQSWRRHRGGMNPGTPPFFLSQPSNLKQASQIWESRNLSFRLLNVFLGGGV